MAKKPTSEQGQSKLGDISAEVSTTELIVGEDGKMRLPLPDDFVLQIIKAIDLHRTAAPLSMRKYAQLCALINKQLILEIGGVLHNDRLTKPRATGDGIQIEASDEIKEAFGLGPRGQAILRAKEAQKRDVKLAGGTFDLQQVTSLLDITRQSVHRMAKRGNLLAVPGPGGSNVYPAAQIQSDGSVVPGLKDVLDALPAKTPWGRLNWLVHPEIRLGDRTPIEVLESGDIDAVVEAASRYGESGS